MGRDDQAWAVFWCSLLAPLFSGEIPEAEREAYFRELSQQERLLPNGQRKTVAVRTLRRWWKRLRDEGVEGTFRRPRSDRGQPRAHQQALLDRAVELKKEQPHRSDVVINRILIREFGRGVPRSTLYRHLRRQGATRRKLGVSQQKIRCRWTRDQPGALWVGDFEHGPPVIHQGRAIETRLSAWIDCHSRYVVEARYYLSEKFDVLVDSLLRAWAHHGASRELYVDNAKIYHANPFKLACTQLNIQLLHRPPRDPPAGGLIERFFQTLQGQLEAEIRAAHLLSLAKINQALAAWLDQEYHQAVHSETHQTPHERYHSSARLQRNVRLQSVLPFFQVREQRTVHRDFSDITLDGLHFAVDPKLRGDKLSVQFDPFACGEDHQEVQLYAPDGAYLGVGRRYQRQKGDHTQPEPRKNSPPIEPAYLDALQAAHTAAQQRQRQAGLDYHSATARSLWPLTSFATLLARLLGRPAGLSSFTSDELDALRTFHARHEQLHESLLRAAVAQAEAATVPHVLWRLQTLLSEGDS